MYPRTCSGDSRVVSVVCVVLVVLCVPCFVCAQVGDFTHEWAAHVEGGDEKAHEIARKHGFDVLTKIFDDVYLLRHRRVARRSADPSLLHHEKLISEPHVRWAEQQVVKRRVKRDFMHQDRSAKYISTWMDDPKWPQMWYLNRGGSLDMNVQPAWAEGVSGKGVVVTILDDGLEKDHPDLIKNYDPNASYDVNSHDPDPMPRYDLVDSNRHGTRCAGEVAADANNSICAVGVAYEASVGGVRMLDGDVTDAVEARSLALNPQHIDIYSASWGPDDDGKTVDGPGQLATRAFVEGIRNGRGGKGSIFVWASGNGGRDQDNCNCDGYTNSIWTLSISSATERGRVPWYSEACSSTLATTYSSGSLGEKQIVTTDLHHSCTSSHTGTSASAPLAAAICALALQVNRDLTWRDMQHIVVRTARPENLEAPDWQSNGVGRHVSHRFGYGLMDAYAMVQLARNWTSVPTQRKCEVAASHIDKLIPQKSFVTLELDVTDCPGVNYLEHVQAKVSLTADRRGDIEIYLSSPSGVKSTLLAQRPHDNSRTGFHSWPFMTVHMWGERPLGKWKLEIHNNGHFFTTDKAEVKEWSLILYGTETEPGQPVSPQQDIQSADESHVSDPAVHQSIDTTEGKTETRDPDSMGVGHSSAAAASPTPTPQALQLTAIQKALPPGCSRVDAAGACIDVGTKKKREILLQCEKNHLLHGGVCVVSCPENYYGFFPERLGATGPPTCRPCHYSCRSCSGPQDYDCSSCWGDAVLYTAYEGQNYCHPSTLHDAYESLQSWYKFLLGILLCLLILVLILAVLVLRAKNASRRLYPVVGVPSLSPGVGAKSASKGGTAYTPVPKGDADDLLTKITFHDLASDDEI
ncbi:furin-like protease 1 isoform X2 [Penaeus monodon]|uniref:furin-like protease 1 isoform X2 n=1 Tax=Penaeus monodon TaxID=6687 RepID=UPI0018A74446|nr:furin-like protease 1 isoform X2 [Penaeus monodon]